MEIEKIKNQIESGKFKALPASYRNFFFFTVQKNELEKRGIAQISLSEFCSVIANSPRAKLLFEQLRNIDLSLIYHSFMHGVRHNVRVALFSFYLSEMLKLDDTDLKIALFAALYHDICRRNDSVDDAHGPLAAAKLATLNLGIAGEDLAILQCIVAVHSVHDSNFEQMAVKFKVKDKQRCRTLMNVLKDSDALDRTRLDMPLVKVDLLRTEFAPRLILAAYDLEFNLKFDKQFESKSKSKNGN